MRTFQKDGPAWYVRFEKRETELLGLPERRHPPERGLNTDVRAEAETLKQILTLAFSLAGLSAGALKLLRDVVGVPRTEDRSLTWAQLLGLWRTAEEKVGRNETAQLAEVLAVRARIPLAPLVEVWAGGEAKVTQRLRNMQRVRRMMATVPGEFTNDLFTPRFVDAYLQQMLKTVTKYTGKATTKRTMLKDRAAINLFAAWLMTPSAANAVWGAGGNEQFVMRENPVSLALDSKIVQKRGDRAAWKKKQLRGFFTFEESKKIVLACWDLETRAMAALMFGAALEFGAFYNSDPKKGPLGATLFGWNFRRDPATGAFTRELTARGLANRGDPTAEELKTRDRTRVNEVPDAEGYGWFWNIAEEYIKTLGPRDRFLTHGARYYRNHFAKAIRLAGFEINHGQLFHVARHSFAQFWNKKVRVARPDGRDIFWLKDQMGHKHDSDTLDEYLEEEERMEGRGVEVIDEELSRTQRGIRLVG